jgi:hypothetical protein
LKYLAIAASSLFVATPVHHHHRPRCPKTYTPEMGYRAARAIYSGTKGTTSRQLHLLGRIEMCQRNKRRDQPRVRTYDRRLGRSHSARIYAKLHPAPTTAYGPWAIPASIVECESTYQNLPPNSAGASGYYQIIPSTWISYGGGQYASQAYLASKAEQDIIAAKIWDGGNGAGQWVCKG